MKNRKKLMLCASFVFGITSSYAFTPLDLTCNNDASNSSFFTPSLPGIKVSAPYGVTYSQSGIGFIGMDGNWPLYMGSVNFVNDNSNPSLCASGQVGNSQMKLYNCQASLGGNEQMKFSADFDYRGINGKLAFICLIINSPHPKKYDSALVSNNSLRVF